MKPLAQELTAELGQELRSPDSCFNVLSITTLLGRGMARSHSELWKLITLNPGKYSLILFSSLSQDHRFETRHGP